MLGLIFHKTSKLAEQLHISSLEKVRLPGFLFHEKYTSRLIKCALEKKGAKNVF